MQPYPKHLVRTMIGEVLASNFKMLHFVSALGFHAAIDAEDHHQMRVTRTLRD